MANKLTNWSGAFAQILDERFKPADNPDQATRDRYLAALRSPAPWQWMSDHLRESSRLRGAVYVAIKVLGDQAAMAEAKAYKHTTNSKTGDQEEKVALPRTHPLSTFLRRPNNHDSGGMIRRRMVQQLSLTGTSLLWRVDDDFMPRELWSIPTACYQPLPISSYYQGGAYRVLPYFPGPLAQIPGAWSAGGVVVPAEQMLAVRHPHPLLAGIGDGLSPLAACSDALDTVDSIDRARFSKMRRGIHPSAVAKTQVGQKLPDDAEMLRVNQQLYQLLGGPERAGKIAWLPPGMDLDEWGQNSDIEVGWIESWSQLVGFILSIFGLTKGIAFQSDELTYATLYASLRQFNLFSMCPLLEQLQDAFNHQVVEPFWGEEYSIEFTPRKVEDEQLTEAQLANDLKAGVRLVGEIRKMRGLEPSAFDDERAYAGTEKRAEPAQDEARTDGGDRQDPAVEKTRPRNIMGRGTGNPRSVANGSTKH